MDFVKFSGQAARVATRGTAEPEGKWPAAPAAGGSAAAHKTSRPSRRATPPFSPTAQLLESPLSLGTCHIGSVYLEGGASLPSVDPHTPWFINTVTLVLPAEEGEVGDNNKENRDIHHNVPQEVGGAGNGGFNRNEPRGARQARSSPLPAIDYGRCIVQVPSEMTDNGSWRLPSTPSTADEAADGGDALYPPPKRQNIPGCASDSSRFRQQSPAAGIAGTPAPSCSDSCATSTSASAATSASGSTNLFDMLRNMFNPGDEEETSDEANEVGEADMPCTVTQHKPMTPPALPAMDRPPLAPITRLDSAGQSDHSAATPRSDASSGWSRRADCRSIIDDGPPCRIDENARAISEEGGPPIAALEAHVTNILCVASSLNDTLVESSEISRMDSSQRSAIDKFSISQREQIASLAERVKILESQLHRGQAAPRSGSSVMHPLLGGTAVAVTSTFTSATGPSSSRATDDFAPLKSKDSAALNPEEMTRLRKCVGWLEEMPRLGIGAGSVPGDDGSGSRERRALPKLCLGRGAPPAKEASRRAENATTDANAAGNLRANAEECLRRTVKDLERKLETEREKHDEASKRMRRDWSSAEEELREEMRSLESELDGQKRMAAEERDAANRLLQSTSRGRGEEIKRLKGANEELLQKQSSIEEELSSRAKDNDALRARLLSVASETALKDATLSESLCQLKSLSEDYYSAQRSLDDERKGRQEEVLSLQMALESMALEMIKLGAEVNELQDENGVLKEKLRKQQPERSWAAMFLGSSRGA